MNYLKKIKANLLILLFIFLCSNNFAQTQIKMEKTGGVFYVPCKVNGLKLKFIFDTGASSVSISLSEAIFMQKNGYLNENDITGTEKYMIANGEIAEGTKIIIKELEIGNLKIYNIEASIVHTLSAPLLLGQSAIERFGSFSIDYKTNTLYLSNEPTLNSNHKKIDQVRTIVDVDTVITKPDCNISLPTAFSPNQDGINDLFRPITLCSNIAKFEIEIFNRWGETVFKTQNPEINWNGSDMKTNEPLVSGSYSYYGTYTVKNNDGTTEEKTYLKSTVTLIR